MTGETDKRGKLKTLKDLTNFDTLSAIELKKETIKWIKEDKEVVERLHPSDVSSWKYITKRWMKRFNITEEDLKEVREC